MVTLATSQLERFEQTFCCLEFQALSWLYEIKKRSCCKLIAIEAEDSTTRDDRIGSRKKALGDC